MTPSKAPALTAAALMAMTLLGGCASGGLKNEAPGPAAQSTGLVSQPARITDNRIFSDRTTLDSVQLRLRKLNEAGVGQNTYALAKAQCWLDTAKTQYAENDRTGYVEESLTEAVKISQALEADKSAVAGVDTPLIARSTRLRDDLWARLGSFKNQSSTLSCNAKTVACAEVRLVRAGHAEEQTGWRQATPHIQMVEDALRTAKIEADNCAQPKAAAAAVPVTVVTAPAATKETYVLLADTLFKFDKSAIGDLLPGGKQRLADVAARLASYKSIQTLSVVGHTDRMGSDAYNDKLAQARAKTVQAYLGSLGVKAVSTEAVGKGKREPTSAAGTCPAKANKAALIQCLQADRRVTIEATGLSK